MDSPQDPVIPIEFPGAEKPVTVEPYPSTVAWPDPPAKFQDRRWLHALLLLLTLGTTTFVGVLHYASFVSDFDQSGRAIAASPISLVHGLWYSLTLLTILGCHEMGHYLACRYYNVDVSLPYFIPMPLLLTGTMGAFIRIRERIPTKRMLFDIGIAGPIAGFVVAVPALFMGLAMSHVVKVPPNFTGYELGEPLLFKLLSKLLWGTQPDGYSINLHPMGFAAWWGLLATALNLFPMGQLDGGHISYAVLGRRSSQVTLAMIPVAIGLTFVSVSWLFWTALMVVMLIVFGRHHPPTWDEHERLDRVRLILAVFAVVMLVLCFTPAPFRVIDLITR